MNSPCSRLKLLGFNLVHYVNGHSRHDVVHIGYNLMRHWDGVRCWNQRSLATQTCRWQDEKWCAWSPQIAHALFRSAQPGRCPWYTLYNQITQWTTSNMICPFEHVWSKWWLIAILQLLYFQKKSAMTVTLVTGSRCPPEWSVHMITSSRLWAGIGEVKNWGGSCSIGGSLHLWVR